MSIPEKVKVGGIVYKVLYTHEPMEANSDVDGATCFPKQEIRLKPGMAKEYTETVFIHELLHCVTESAVVDFGDADETIIKSLAQVLYQVLKENSISFD